MFEQELIAKMVEGAVYESRDGKTKYRTTITGTNRSTYNNLFCVEFSTAKLDENGDVQYVSYTAGSANLFDTEEEALDAGYRALEALAATGMYPNMCEKF